MKRIGDCHSIGPAGFDDIDEMAGILKRINQERGIAILVAEQDLDFCLSIASRAYVMEKGSIRLETDRDSLKADKALQQELLGV